VSACTLLSRLQQTSWWLRNCTGDELRPDSKVQHSCASRPIGPSAASKLRASSKLQIFAPVSSLLNTASTTKHYLTADSNYQ
jgi:hypothetical protein